MVFNVQQMPFWYTKFQQISLPWEGDTPIPPLPRSVASLPRFAPPPVEKSATPVLKNTPFRRFLDTGT